MSTPEVTQAAAVPLFFSTSDPISLNLPSSPRTTMPETTHYNVYRVHIRHYSGTINHEALALVASHREDQSAGRFYHVVSRGSLDRNWKQRTKFNFGAVQGYIGQELLFRIEKASLARWEEIVGGLTQPCDFAPLFGRIPLRPGCEPFCRTWVGEVLRQVEGLKVKE